MLNIEIIAKSQGRPVGMLKALPGSIGFAKRNKKDC